MALLLALATPFEKFEVDIDSLTVLCVRIAFSKISCVVPVCPGAGGAAGFPVAPDPVAAFRAVMAMVGVSARHARPVEHLPRSPGDSARIHRPASRQPGNNVA